MSEHEEIRSLLSLAAAGVLEETEEQRVAVHVARCTECAAELESWQALAGGLRRLPTPQAPAALVERVRARATAELAVQAEEQFNRRVLAFLVLFSWAVAVASWPIVRFVTQEVLGWFHVQQIWFSVAGYTLLGWLTAGVAAGLLGGRARAARRFV
jgi:anti-sigma factor RsiW